MAMLTEIYIEALLEQVAPPGPELVDFLKRLSWKSSLMVRLWSWLICGCWAARLAR
jgi:hypothetical protein